MSQPDYRERMRAARAQRSRMYGTAKRIIALALLLGLAALALLALNWRKLLSAEQKLRYGMVFEATRDLGEKALSRPEDSEHMGRYLDALVQEGNLGRAFYLADLYGAEGADGNAELEQLRQLVLKSRAASLEQQVYDIKADPAYSALEGRPCQQVLRYLYGYRHALSGDWASARNELAAIDPKKLPPALRPYRDYYLARGYRLAGTDAEKAEVEGRLLKLIDEDLDPGLTAKARYNLLAWYLNPESGGGVEEGKARRQLESLQSALSPNDDNPALRWALLKARTEFAKARASQGQPVESFGFAAQALLLDPDDPAAAEAGGIACDALALALKGEAEGALNAQKRLLWRFAPGFGPALARSARSTEELQRFSGVLREADKTGLAQDDGAQLKLGLAMCYRRLEDAARLKTLMTQANLAGVGDAELGGIYWEYAELMQQREQWNEALSYYKSCGKLAGEHQAEAVYECYHVLKEVQEPLNIEAALGYLREVVGKHEGKPGYYKAFEEMLPLLIYRGQRDAARKLIAEARDYPTVDYGSLEEFKTLNNWKLVASFWDANMDAPGRPQLPEHRTAFWNYYEMVVADPPAPAASDGRVEELSGGEIAAEYLAGLGLADEAEESRLSDVVIDAMGPSDLLSYLRFSQSSDTALTAILQDQSTALIESGGISDRAVLDYVLSLAYPQPFGDEVRAAASATGVEPALIYAIMKKESAFRADNESWVGAEGLMQVMPGTVRFLIDARGLPADYFARRLEPKVNIRLGAEYIASLAQQLGVEPRSDSGVRAILHSYNGGPANYQKWKGLYPNADPVLFTSVVPNEQNETYVMLVYKYYKIYKWLEQQ